ncbi:MAG: FGGY-family carbohydrate kinase [Armatimonadota bacterium]
MFLVGIDLGTSSTKCLILGPDGTVVGRGTVPIGCELRSGGFAELRAEEWWESARAAVREALALAPKPIGSAAMSISSQGLSFVLLGADDQPLRPAISTLDTRAEGQAAALTERISESELFALTGKRAAPYYLLPKLLWLRENEPQVLAETRRIALAMDYLAGRLIGEPAPTDHSLASGSALHDVRRLEWSAQLAQRFDVDLSMMPQLAPAGTFAGELTGSVADGFGLPKGTVVAVGGQDQKCAALAAGLSPEVGTVSIGTAAACEFISTGPVLDPHLRLPCFPYVRPGHWVVEGALPAAGGALQWLARVVSPADDPERVCPLLEEAARQADWGATPLFAPHLGGAGSPHWQRSAKGLLGELTLATGRGELARAVLEGVCMELAANVEAASSLGLGPSALRAFGGGSRSDFWLQLLADSLDLPVVRLQLGDAAALGACLLAAGAVGHAVPDATKAPEPRLFSPTAEGAARCRERRARYLALCN